MKLVEEIMAMIQLLVIAAVVLSGVKSEGYDGYKLYLITPKTPVQAEILHQLHSDPNFDILQEAKAAGSLVRVMASPEVQGYFEEALEKFTEEGLEYQILSENVQTLLDDEYSSFVNRSLSLKASTRALWDDYHSHDYVLEYLHQLERQYPEIVKLESIGESYEGRDLLLINIGRGGPDTPTIFIDAGIHAREWIATPTALYIIYQLVENPDNARLHANINWAIIPALNPDGYEYSRSSAINRLWRKTRRPNPGNTCIGTDPNRNFGYMWNTGGASSNPCDDTYAGPEPFSEPETDAIRRYFQEHYAHIRLYVSIHSYGNYILYPWGYTSALPPDALQLQYIGEDAARSVEIVSTLGSRYTIGSSTNVLYVASGGSDDWTKGVFGVALSYCWELPAGGLFGFNPPDTMIRPIVEETWEGFAVLGEKIDNLYG